MSVKIDISSFKEGSHSFQIFSDAADLNLNDNLINDLIIINIELLKSANQLDIKISVSGNMNLECDKCLESFVKPFKNEFELVYIQKSRRDFDDSYDEDLRFYNPWIKYIDITDDIKQSVVLAVPMKCVPGENETGECLHCGRTQNFWKNILLDEEELNN